MVAFRSLSGFSATGKLPIWLPGRLTLGHWLKGDQQGMGSINAEARQSIEREPGSKPRVVACPDTLLSQGAHGASPQHFLTKRARRHCLEPGESEPAPCKLRNGSQLQRD